MPNTTAGKPAKRSHSPQGLRLPDDLLARIDRYARQLEAELHISVTRSDAIRRLIVLGLEDAEDIREAEAILRAGEERVPAAPGGLAGIGERDDPGHGVRARCAFRRC